MSENAQRRWEMWGPLAERYQEERPRRILALDGGGIRGMITLGVLARLEAELRRELEEGPQFRLCDFFDLIGGTSTGAIIAAALARRMSVAEVAVFYRDFGRKIFVKRRLWERTLLGISVGTGSAPVIGAPADDPDTNVLSSAVNTLSALMSQASVDQDVNCRVIGRCTYGGIIDKELHDLIAADPGSEDRKVPLEQDLGKAFTYVRYNAELTAEGLAQLG